MTTTLSRDLTAGLVVFLVALPLCMGVALASNAPVFSGIIAGVLGGILVGLLSGSHTSVSGPSPAVIPIVAAQIILLGSFEAFLVAVVLAGVIQVALGLARVGFLAAFVPSPVIKGLLAGIGVILILKQIPHVVGHDPDPEGDMAFMQPDQENTFSELFKSLGDIHPEAAIVGFSSLLLLAVWDRVKRLKESPVPAPLLVVLMGIGFTLLFKRLGQPWEIEASHLVNVPVPSGFPEFRNQFAHPDFSALAASGVFTAAVMIAAVVSLETLVNLEAVDQIDPYRRASPPSRELIAQGLGNICSGLVGGLPITSVIVRSSVNINAGGRTRLATIVHGILLLLFVTLLPNWLNLIPLASLAAILLYTGFKLINPAILQRMWQGGKHLFAPFAATVLAIVVTDLVTGVLIGLAVSTAFILWSNVRQPLRRTIEKHPAGEVVRIELANQVSFLNRAALMQELNKVPGGGHVLLDARHTDYIDPDVLALIRGFKDRTGPARSIEVSLLGFRQRYQLKDQTQYVDYATRELQRELSPAQVLQILKDGHERFRTGRRLTRDLSRQVSATGAGQFPLAVVLSCIDSRSPAELIFDLGVGDIFSVRIAGNVSGRKVLGSIEYACAVAGAKLVLVLGHTRCGAVTAAVDLAGSGKDPAETTGCEHIGYLVEDLQQALDGATTPTAPADREAFIDGVARRNVIRVAAELMQQSQTLGSLVAEGRIAVVGAMYDVVGGGIAFLGEETVSSR